MRVRTAGRPVPRPSARRPSARRHRSAARAATVATAVLLGAVTIVQGGGATKALAADPALVPAPAPAEYPQWVALGDSYASGEGAGESEADETSFFDAGTLGGCDRSPYAYSRLLSLPGSLPSGARAYQHDQGLSSLGYDLQHVACSGATTSDVLDRAQRGTSRPQLAHLSDRTDLVTITIGGNDIGFSDIARACLAPPLGRNGAVTCQEVLEKDGKPAEIDRLGPRLQETYSKILGAAGNAKVAVVGYPQIIAAPNAKADNANRHVDPSYCSAHLRGAAALALYEVPAGDRLFLRSVVQRLNAVIRSAVDSIHSNRISYVDVEDAFGEPNEGFCGTGKAMNGAEAYVPSERWGLKVNHNSLHPTRDGYAMIAARVLPQLQALDEGGRISPVVGSARNSVADGH